MYAIYRQLPLFEQNKMCMYIDLSPVQISISYLKISQLNVLQM